ncbi:MAG: restriction endonuclease subunit S [Deltaproteobacteria bacterium]
MNDDNPLPAGWNTTNVGACCQKPEYGFTESAVADEVGPKFFRITDIAENGVNWDTVPYCRCPENIFPKYELKENDILFARIGATTGKSYIVKNPPQAVFASYLIRLRPLSNVIPDYLYYFFNSDGYWTQVNANKKNNLKGGVNSSTLSDIRFPLPSKKEQQKIATILSKIQQAIEIQESLIEKTRELKNSTLNHVFTQGLRGEKKKETEIGPIPVSWSVQRFEEFAILHRGYDLPIQDRTSGSVPIVGSNGVVGYHDQSKVKGPGVVTGRSGTIGISYYVADDYWPLNTGLYVEDFHGNDPLYVHYFFQSFNFGQHAAGVSVPTLNRNLVHAVLISVVPIVEQKEIAHILKTIDQKIDLHEAKKSALQDLFKTMLNKLMMGEIRVKDLDIDISEVSA